jgi:hypothetical protein
MSKTRAEIEAEIARLTARLDHVEIDPAFTPTELVRWDPSLLGTVLHIKHELNIPANAFSDLISEKVSIGNRRELDDAYGRMVPRNPSEKKMEMVGVLIPGGIHSIQSLISDGWEEHNPIRYIYAVNNDFDSMARLPLPFLQMTYRINETAAAAQKLISCKELRMTIVPNGCPHAGAHPYNLILPLANPDRPLLDQIFVANTIRLPVTNVDVVVDKYPLSTLYNEWKRDKEAARGLPPPRRTELDAAKAQIAELQAQMRVLMAERTTDRAKEADLSKQNGRLRDALHVAVGTPNLKGFVAETPPALPAKAAAPVVASSNATGSTNATAAADPV